MTAAPRTALRLACAVLALGLAGLALAVPAGALDRVAASRVAAPDLRAADDAGAYSQTKTVERVFVEADGTRRVVDTREVTVEVDQTQDLRGRQRVRVSWSGARPSQGRASNPYGENGLQQEYPVVIMQCRGLDDPSLPPAQQLRPETCWTASVAQRSQIVRSSSEQTWTKDLYADPAARSRVSPDPFPAEACKNADVAPYATHLTAFEAAGGTVFPACNAETMPPEAAVGAAFPPAEIAAFTDLAGNGSVQFEVRSNVENESLGCTQQVRCSLVVIPIAGISCDQPATPTTTADRTCRRTGQLEPGSSNFENYGIDQAVGPSLWWSESNWRNRFSVPLTFGLPPDACDVLDDRPPTGFYGSELLTQAGLQWAPAYCLNQQRFKFQLNRMSDIQAFNLMDNGGAAAAEVSSARTALSGDPVGYAPTAVTGFAVGYVIDEPRNQGEFTQLRLNARLLAKLLTQSYLASDLGRRHPGMEGNPLSIMSDPEFTTLNPELSTNDQEAAATILSLSESSDVIQELTEYIASDADAMAFVAGKPDPDGMVVNPAYKNIELPRSEWPLLDTYVPETQNPCRQANPQVYFTSVAAPVTTLRKISDALLDAWPNVQTRCESDPASTTGFKLGRIDRQAYGARFMLGVVSLGDAARYGLRSAALETSPGRYVGPTPTALGRAVAITRQSGPRQPFELDQDAVREAGDAYPGTMVVYTAAKTSGLEQETADKVAQFIRVSTTEGQRPGSGNGQLPAGFLPITAQGPTAKLLASAKDVADAVEAQVPPEEPTAPPTGTPTDPPPSAPPTGTPTDPPVGSNGPDSDGDGVPDVVDPLPDNAAPVADAPPADEAPADEVAAAGSEDVLPTSATPGTGMGIAGKLLPGLLLLVLLGAAWHLGSRFFVRVPRGPR